MKCAQIQKMLPAFLDGVLSKTENALVQKHLEACDSCRTAFEEYQDGQRLIQDLDPVEPPPGFAQKIMARLEEEEEKKGGILRKLFYPLHIKIPIQTVVTVTIAVLAIQAYRSVEPRKDTPSQIEITAPSEPRERAALEKDLPKEAVPPAEKPLPPLQVTPREREGVSRDAVTTPPPASAPRAATRLREEEAMARPPQDPGSAAAPKDTGKAEIGAAGQRAKMEAKTSVPAPSRESVSLEKRAKQVGLTLHAVNPTLAGERIRLILQEMGGSHIVRTRLGEEEIVTADLNPQRFAEFIERLNDFAEMKGQPLPPQSPASSVSIRIRIIKRESSSN